MPSLTFFPLGNADCCRIDLDDGRKLLFDYAACRDQDDPRDRRADLPTELRRDLQASGRDRYEVVAFTHLDDDHITGSTDFFWLEHDKKYQSKERIRIDVLWVPAAVITEDKCDGEAAVIQAEARFRLKRRGGIRVFSRPQRLEAWLLRNGMTLGQVSHLITDAGRYVPGYDEGPIEFFVHSPFATRLNDGGLEDRNQDSLVLQASFNVGAEEPTRLILSADTPHESWDNIVDNTRRHRNDDRLMWDVFKLAHHCSYLSLGPEKGGEKTKPTNKVRWLFETQGQSGGIIVSTSDPIPVVDGDADSNIQPPHRQAANYYKQDVVRPKGGQFMVTMEHPTTRRPEPLVIRIDGSGARVEKQFGGGAAVVFGGTAPRAG